MRQGGANPAELQVWVYSRTAELLFCRQISVGTGIGPALSKPGFLLPREAHKNQEKSPSSQQAKLPPAPGRGLAQAQGALGG